jgi:iron complex outermembrane receptor protein
MTRQFCALLLATVALAPLAARAQTAAQAAPAAAAAPSDTSTQEIVVTAQKRSERLQDVPVAITALSGSQLAASNITDLRQLVNVAPALRMDQTGIFTQPTIRGVGSAVTGPGSDSNVATYVDGFYQPSQAGNDFDLSNVTQVEVLKGPQGTLFGRNATGGAILVTTKDPGPTAGGDVELSYRSFNDVRGQLYFQAPITDKLWANIAVYERSSDGFKQDATTGQNTAPVKTDDVRIKLLYQPLDQLKFTLTLQHVDLSDPIGAAYSAWQGNSIGNEIPGAVVTSARDKTSFNDQPKNQIQSDAVYLKSQYSLGWATLTSYTAYHYEKDKEVSDLDVSNAPVFSAFWNQREETFTQELNLGSSGKGPLDWVVGAFYFHDKSGYPHFFFNAADYGGAQWVQTNAYAGFADATYEVLHNLYLTAGVRYSSETQAFSYDSPVAPFVSPGTPAVALYDHTWTSVNERAVLRYKFSADSNVYFSYSNGFKSGAYNTLSWAPKPVDPESIDAFEVGFKTAQHSWRFDSSAYYYDYKNLQFTAYQFLPNGSSVIELENAAKATIYGADAQLTYNFTHDLDVHVGGAWTHARYDAFPGATAYTPNTAVIGGVSYLVGNTEVVANAKGKTLVRAPDFTATLGADYKTDLPYGRMVLAANAYFSTKVYFDPANMLSQPDYATLDFKATWVMPNEVWSVSVFGDNVTDTKYVTQLAPSGFGTGAIYGYPSVFGVEVGAKF